MKTPKIINPGVPALEIHDLTVAYEKKPVLWNIDFQIPPGKITAIIGPNGAGKSTLLKAVLNLIKPLSGWVEFFGNKYTEERHRIAYVPQKESVDWDFPTNVLDVALMGRYGYLGWLRRPAREDYKIALESLKKVDMLEFKDRHINDLSGGQKQRVFLARALAQEADMYFLDEPFSGIDAATEKAIVTLLKELGKKNKSIFVVHHDLETVENYFDWIIMLNVYLVASGPLKETFIPKNIHETYGGKLEILDEMQQLIEKK